MWVQTKTGRKLDLLKPDWRAIDFDGDVAPALSRLARFNGHTKFAYSVAQHCALGAHHFLRAGAPGLALEFLLHDAHEAYLGDITSPVIAAVCDTRRLRDARALLDRAIWRAATGEAAPETSPEIHRADLALLRAERDQICAPPPARWDDPTEAAFPLPVTIDRWSEDDARIEWLTLLETLTRSKS